MGLVLGRRRRLLLGILGGLHRASSSGRGARLAAGRASVFPIAVLRRLVIGRRLRSGCAAGLVVVYDEGSLEDGRVEVRGTVVVLGDILALLLGPGLPGGGGGAVAPRDGRGLSRAAGAAAGACLLVGGFLAGLFLGDDPVERALEALEHDGHGGRVSQDNVVGSMRGEARQDKTEQGKAKQNARLNRSGRVVQRCDGTDLAR